MHRDISPHITMEHFVIHHQDTEVMALNKRRATDTNQDIPPVKNLKGNRVLNERLFLQYSLPGKRSCMII